MLTLEQVTHLLQMARKLDESMDENPNSQLDGILSEFVKDDETPKVIKGLLENLTKDFKIDRLRRRKMNMECIRSLTELKEDLLLKEITNEETK